MDFHSYEEHSTGKFPFDKMLPGMMPTYNLHNESIIATVHVPKYENNLKIYWRIHIISGSRDISILKIAT